MTDPTYEQVKDMVDSHFRNTHKIPTVGDLDKKWGGIENKKAVQNMLLTIKRQWPILRIFKGKLYTLDGEIVWVQQTQGSLVPANYRQLDGIGPTVLP